MCLFRSAVFDTRSVVRFIRSVVFDIRSVACFIQSVVRIHVTLSISCVLYSISCRCDFDQLCLILDQWSVLFNQFYMLLFRSVVFDIRSVV